MSCEEIKMVKKVTKKAVAICDDCNCPKSKPKRRVVTNGVTDFPYYPDGNPWGLLGFLFEHLRLGALLLIVAAAVLYSGAL